MADNKVIPWEDYHYEPRLLDMYQILGMAMGGTTMIGTNVYRRFPPLYRPMVNMPIYLGGGLVLGTVLMMARDRMVDKKRRIAEAYIQQNPSQFVEEPKKQYKDLLLQWHAKR